MRVSIGLVGYNDRYSGLGLQNWELWAGVKDLCECWYAIQHIVEDGQEDEGFGPGAPNTVRCYNNSDVDLSAVTHLLFWENHFGFVGGKNKKRGIMGVNEEWFDGTDPVHEYIDLYICPNESTYHTVLKHFPDKARHIRWGVDLERFKYTERTKADRFLMVEGGGGVFLRDKETQVDIGRRKGLKVLSDALMEVPGVNCAVKTLDAKNSFTASSPANMQIVIDKAEHPWENYVGYDVNVQPTYAEGTALQLLEGMAMGLPLITTDARPMNSFHPWIVIPCVEKVVELGKYNEDGVYKRLKESATVHIPDHKSLAGILLCAQGRNIAMESRAGRRRMEKKFDIKDTMNAIRGELLTLIDNQPVRVLEDVEQLCDNGTREKRDEVPESQHESEPKVDSPS